MKLALITYLLSQNYPHELTIIYKRAAPQRNTSGGQSHPNFFSILLTNAALQKLYNLHPKWHNGATELGMTTDWKNIGADAALKNGSINKLSWITGRIRIVGHCDEMNKII